MANLMSLPIPSKKPSSEGLALSWVYLYHLSRSPSPLSPTYICHTSVFLMASSFFSKSTAIALSEPSTIEAVAVTEGFIIAWINHRTVEKSNTRDPMTNGRKRGEKSIGSALDECPQTLEAIYHMAANPASACPSPIS